MPARSTLLRLAAASVVGATSLAGAVSAAVPADATTSAAYAYLARLNHERTTHGLRPLTMRTDLNGVAQRWATHMAAVRVLSHNPRLASQVTNWRTAGENVGEGPSISSLDSAFWHSPGHRSNILDRTYRDVGIGTAVSHGIIWITVDFRDPMYAESSATIARPRTATAHLATHRTLRYGSRGSDVALVQRKLHITADGIFGPRTRSAVIAFQRRHHLPANGVVGASTWRALGL